MLKVDSTGPERSVCVLNLNFGSFFFFFNREIQQTESVKLKKHFEVPLISHSVNKGWLMDWVLEHDSVTRLYVWVFKLQCWPSSPQRCGMSLEIYVIHSWQHSPKVFEGTGLHQSWLLPRVESAPPPAYCASKWQTSRTWIDGPVAPVLTTANNEWINKQINWKLLGMRRGVGGCRCVRKEEVLFMSDC